ncbi:MAG: hypothetical protein Q7R50_03120 [Dehalococcoidales bacterium]|nr:hypothetical protein [Dehalococcoidales bacterium]
MAQKAATQKKVVKKSAAKAKPAARTKVTKGQALECQVCGLAVVVEEVGGVAIGEERVLLCCDEPMKPKASKAKAKTAKK